MKPTVPELVIVTVRAAVSPGTRFAIEISEAAALLSLDSVSVADPNWFPGLVVVAVKLALELSEVTVRPISTSAERAMPARRIPDLRIVLVLSGSRPFVGRVLRTELSLLGRPEPSAFRGRPPTSLG